MPFFFLVLMPVYQHIQIELALVPFHQAGGVTMWVDRSSFHLMIKRFNTEEHRIPLSNFPLLPNVKRLMLHGYDFDDKDVEALAAWKHLDEFHLINCHDVTDKGLKHLATFTNLQRITIWDSKVNGSGFKSLSKLTKLSRLEVQNSPVDDAAIQSVTQWKQLKQLDLYNTRVTAQGIKPVRQALPDCAIEID